MWWFNDNDCPHRPSVPSHSPTSLFSHFFSHRGNHYVNLTSFSDSPACFSLSYWGDLQNKLSIWPTCLLNLITLWLLWPKLRDLGRTGHFPSPPVLVIIFNHGMFVDYPRIWLSMAKLTVFGSLPRSVLSLLFLLNFLPVFSVFPSLTFLSGALIIAKILNLHFLCLV